MSSVLIIILKSALMMLSTQLVIWAQSAKRKAQSLFWKFPSAISNAQSAKRKAQSAGEGNYIIGAAFSICNTSSSASVHVASFVNLGLRLIVIEIFVIERLRIADLESLTLIWLGNTLLKVLEILSRTYRTN